MPLTEKGQEILSSMKNEYGDKKGEQVFYASANAGKIKDVHDRLDGITDAAKSLAGRFDAFLTGASEQDPTKDQPQMGGLGGGVPVRVKG